VRERPVVKFDLEPGVSVEQLSQSADPFVWLAQTRSIRCIVGTRRVVRDSGQGLDRLAATSGPNVLRRPRVLVVREGNPARDEREAMATDAASSGSWEEVVHRLVADRGDALERYAYFVSGSREDAADLVQDALVKAFGRLRNGFTVTSAEAYVRRAILNGFIDAGRRQSRWRRIRHLEVPPPEVDSPAIATEARLDLHGELEKLSPRERACLVLRYYDDLKVDDIADTLGLSSGAVKRYLSDGLGKMAVALRPDDNETDSGSEARRAR
jgi:RNA polymerase sigma factor (sigma-70 family)